MSWSLVEVASLRAIRRPRQNSDQDESETACRVRSFGMFLSSEDRKIMSKIPIGHLMSGGIVDLFLCGTIASMLGALLPDLSTKYYQLSAHGSLGPLQELITAVWVQLCGSCRPSP